MSTEGRTASGGGPSSEEEITAEIRSFLEEETLWGELGDSFADDQPLLESGLVDSFELASLVTRLEERFEVDMAAGISRDDFESVRTICALVRRSPSRAS